MGGFTPGPWKAAWNDDGSWVGVDTGNRAAGIAEIVTENIEMDDEEAVFDRAKADANLIAAAPEMHEVLELCGTALFHVSQGMAVSGLPELMARIEDILAKAKGGA